MPVDFDIKLRGKIRHYGKPAVMGIINATPDSFYDKSRCSAADDISRRAQQMVAEGADFIDVGACSTRPGAELVSAEEELDRLAPAIAAIREAAPDTPISVDTFRSEVARIAVTELGADIVNDVTGGNEDDKMFQTVAEINAPYILTYMKGKLGQEAEYGDFPAEVVADLEKKVHALNLLGVNDIIIDPGFGFNFNKTLEQNYQLMRMLPTLKIWHLPILVGVSRKSMITKLLGIDAADALAGTVALNTCALWQGATILRVHDVAAAKQAIEIFVKSTQTNHLC